MEKAYVICTLLTLSAIVTEIVLALPAPDMKKEPMRTWATRVSHSLAIASVAICSQMSLIDNISASYSRKLAAVVMATSIAVLSYILYSIFERIGTLASQLVKSNKQRQARKQALNRVLSNK